MSKKLGRLLRLTVALVAVNLVGARVAMAIEFCCDDVQCAVDSDDRGAEQPCPVDCSTCQCGHSGFAFVLDLRRTDTSISNVPNDSISTAYAAQSPPMRTLPGVFHPPRAA